MPKLKTHSGAKKRFNLTASGKVKRARAFKSHILTKKTTKRTRHLRETAYADQTNVSAIKKMIPFYQGKSSIRDMARVKGAMMTRKRRNATLKLAKGYWGSKSKHFKMAKQQVMKSGNYAFKGRKQKKRDFRRLWIARISASVAPYGMNSSTFMNGVKKAGIEMNRKSLSERAIQDSAAFAAVVEKAKAALN